MASGIMVAERVHPNAGRQAAGRNVHVEPAEPAFRMSLRAPQKSVTALSKSLGLALPKTPKASTSKNQRAALWLGPDEWLIVDTSKSNPVDALSKTRVLHSAVDISHRNTAIIISGAGAEAVLSAGCPQDLSRKVFDIGACSRTVLGKAEVVLWRTGSDVFRLECWRSFSTYVFDFLEEAARDADL